MINKLIEGKLVTLIVGGAFRIVEIFIRAIHLAVRGVRLLVQEVLTSRIDRWISMFGKRMVANTTPVDDSSIVLVEKDGEYTCDPKYIAEEILRRGAPYKITWVLRDQSIGPFPREFRFVRHGTADFFRAVAGAKVVIQNSHSLQESGAVKGPSQHWLQSWHGSLALNKPEGAGDDRRKHDVRMRRLANTHTDFVLTNSRFEDEVSTSTYGPDVPKLMLGHARNDLLLDTSQETADELRKKVLGRLDIADTGQKFLLYAPTRGDSTGAVSLSGIDIIAVRAALSAKFGGTWDILIGTHSTSKAQSDMWLAGLPAYCHDASFYPDVQELLVLADAGVADHSSWIRDYILTNKPSFLFSTNVDVRTRQRGTHHRPEDTPFTIATSNHELLSSIEQFDQEVYSHRIVQFLELCGSADDGRAAPRIVDKIEELMAR